MAPGISWSKKQGAATLCLHQGLGGAEATDPYGGAPVQLLPELASTDEDKVLFLLQSPHGEIPNKYFVCSWQNGNLVWLPPVTAILLPGSIGLLNSINGSYHVAHLAATPNQNTGDGEISQGSVHVWKYTPSSSSSSPNTGPWRHRSDQVALPLINCTNWHAHRVVPFNGKVLMWVDLNHGILHMSPSVDKPASFKFVELPKELSSIKTKPWRNNCPEMFRSVGCCNNKLKLVNLHIPHRTNNIVALDIWTLDSQNQNWRKDKNVSLNLNCRELWASYTNLPWPNSVPIFPFLSKDNCNILYLTVVGENKKAWLLQIDMKAKTLKAVTEYPRDCNHMKPLFHINSSPKRTMILWPATMI